jgi:hypothetical protein
MASGLEGERSSSWGAVDLCGVGSAEEGRSVRRAEGLDEGCSREGSCSEPTRYGPPIGDPARDGGEVSREMGMEE